MPAYAPCRAPWRAHRARQGGQGYLRGLAKLDVEGEMADGIAMARIGENARAVIILVKQRLAELQPAAVPWRPGLIQDALVVELDRERLIPTRAGGQLALGQVARLCLESGSHGIRTESGLLLAYSAAEATKATRHTAAS